MTDMQSRPTLAENIRAARVAAGLSQMVAAGRIGIQQGNLSDLELGKRGASLNMLTRIAAALNTTVSNLTKDM